MINKIKIQNFKSITDLEIQLGKLNVFIGENGCGKTNILEAIICCSIVAGPSNIHELTDLEMSERGIRIPKPDLLKSAFSTISVNDKINICISNEFDEKFVLEIFDYEQGKEQDDYDIYIPSFFPINSGLFDIREKNNDYLKNIKLQKNNLIRRAELRKYFGKIFKPNSITSFLNYAPENYFLRRFEEEGQLKPLGIRGEGLFKHLTDIYKKKPELLKNIGERLRLISWFESFEISKDLFFNESRINIKDKYLKEIEYFDQRSANEGFLYLLFYFTLFISPFTPSFFAIDNIDNSLNPKLCSELTKQLTDLSKQNNKQVILTTHNPAILDGLDLSDNDQRLFTIYRNSEGHTVAKRINEPKKVKGVESVRLSEAYIRGYIGGLPKNF